MDALAPFLSAPKKRKSEIFAYLLGVHDDGNTARSLNVPRRCAGGFPLRRDSSFSESPLIGPPHLLLKKINRANRSHRIPDKCRHNSHLKKTWSGAECAFFKCLLCRCIVHGRSTFRSPRPPSPKTPVLLQGFRFSGLLLLALALPRNFEVVGQYS